MMAKDVGPGQTWNTRSRSNAFASRSLSCTEEREGSLFAAQNGELTYEQIAEVRNCPVSTVKTQNVQALESSAELGAQSNMPRAVNQTR